MSDNIGDWLASAAKAAPSIDPHMLVATTQVSSSRAQAVDNAGGTQGLGDAYAMRQVLEAQDDKIAYSTWSKMPTEQQAGLVNIGYKPPAKPNSGHHGGLLSRVAGDVMGVDKAIGDAVVGSAEDWAGAAKNFVSGADKAVPGLGAIDRGGNRIVGDVVHSSPVRFGGRVLADVATPVQKVTNTLDHAYRAAALITDAEKQDGDNFLQTFTDSRTWSPSEWMKMWQNSSNGNATYSPVELNKARSRWGDETVSLAVQLASGAKQTDLLNGVKDPTQQQLLAEKLGSADFKDAFAFVNASHISFGRRLVGPSLAVSQPGLHMALSGGADFLAKAAEFSELDPVAAVTALPKSFTAARYAIQTSEDVHNAFDTLPAVRREFENVAAALRDGGPGQLLADNPRWGSVAYDLHDAGVRTATDVRDWYASQAAQTATLAGDINGAQSAERIIPHVGAFGERTQLIKKLGTQGIEWAKASDNPMMAGGGKFIDTLVSQLPRSSLFNLQNGNSIGQVYDYARQFLPRDAAINIANEWAGTSDPGERIRVLVSMVRDMGDTMGLNETNSDLVRSVFGDMRDGLAGHAFSPTGVDITPTATGSIRAALDPTQTSQMIALPSYRDWLAAAGKYHMLGVNGDTADKFMQTWRTGTILRPAFALRAGGDELLMAMLRYKPSEMARAALARSATSNEFLTPLHNLYEAATSHLSPELKEAIDGPRDLVAGLLFDNTRRAFRNVEGRLAGPTYMKAAEALANDPGVREAFARTLSANAHGVQTFQPFEVPNMEIRKGGRWVPVQLQSTRAFANYEQGEQVFPLALAVSWKHLSDGPFFSEAMRALADGKTDAEAAEQVATKIADPEMRKVRSTMVRNRIDGQGRTAYELADGTVLGQSDPTVKFGQAAGGMSSSSQDTIELNRPEIQRNYRMGLQWERGMGGPGSQVNQVVLAKLDVNPTELQNWFEQHGGPTSYERFIREQEKARIDLDVHTDLRHIDTSPTTIAKETQVTQLAFDRMNMPFGTPLNYVTPSEAYGDWAERVVAHVKHMVSGEDGINHDVVQRLIAGEVPDLDEISKMNERLLPASAVGPELLPVDESRVKGLVDKGFSTMVGRPMDWLVRQPMFVHNYAVALDQIEGRAAELGLSADDIGKLALHRTVNDTVPFIHDVRQRSQFAVVTRNLFPFWFAQEQAYKRFARSIAFAPDEFRKAMLLVHGISHSGFMEKDQRGEAIFHYPGHQLLQEALAPVLGTLFGPDAVTMPVSAGFSGMVKAANPLTEHLGLPNTSPLVSLPLHAVTGLFPELKPLDETVTGAGGSFRTWYQDLLPSSIDNFIEAWNTHNGQYISAMNTAIAQLEATGNGLPDGADTQQTQAYIDRVQKWARGALFTRAVLGLFAPASPKLDISGWKLNGEFAQLVHDLGSYDQAFTAFVKLHPNDNIAPWTVAKSKSGAGASIPNTATSFRFMTNNEDLLRSYPQGGAWLIPDQDGKFDSTAYREQLALDMRAARSPDEMLTAIKFAEGKDAYFAARDAKDRALLANKHNSAARTNILNIWSDWSATYERLHPLFADVINNPQGANNRDEVRRQLHGILGDQRTPTSPKLRQITPLLNAYDDLQSRLDLLKNHRDTRSVQLRESFSSTFSGWAKQYVADNPEASSFYHAIIEPDVKVKTP